MRRETTKFDSMSMKRKSLCCSEWDLVIVLTSKDLSCLLKLHLNLTKEEEERINNENKFNQIQRIKRKRFVCQFFPTPSENFNQNEQENKIGKCRFFFVLDKFRATSRDPNKLNTNKDFHWRTPIWLETNDRFVSKKFYLLVVVLWSSDEDEFVFDRWFVSMTTSRQFSHNWKMSFHWFSMKQHRSIWILLKKKETKKERALLKTNNSTWHTFSIIGSMIFRNEPKHRIAKSMFQSKF